MDRLWDRLRQGHVKGGFSKDNVFFIFNIFCYVCEVMMRWNGMVCKNVIYVYYNRVPSHSGNQGKPWKWVFIFPVREFGKNAKNHGKLREFDSDTEGKDFRHFGICASCAMCPSCVRLLTGYGGLLVFMQYEYYYYTSLQTITPRTTSWLSSNL